MLEEEQYAERRQDVWPEFDRDEEQIVLCLQLDFLSGSFIDNNTWLAGAPDGDVKPEYQRCADQRS
ncbi:hypothetical protein ACFFTM_15340 [Pseudoduganella plicata]|uniref:Uncharacterized protein n=1 Tax=Pseudoduganella plicata TaxID=321984 RepID=A0A4P7BJS5_9BURK|nr:hypothetical protein [Pseudoduganella plicata]QBQ39181.1 hypothetical protein E1742_25910 [Pseudoduganella plicata]GGY88004.1 hypothetical protein GCM10007388_21770 [Pseudoduganella plicata]